MSSVHNKRFFGKKLVICYQHGSGLGFGLGSGVASDQKNECLQKLWGIQYLHLTRILCEETDTFVLYPHLLTLLLASFRYCLGGLLLGR